MEVINTRYKPYPAYKDSGVEWLGDIPKDWQVKRLKNTVERLESGGTPESDNFSYWTDGELGIPWVAISDMTRSYRVLKTTKGLTTLGLQSKRLPVLPAGTLLYSMYASLGKVALLEINAVVNQAILGLVTRRELALRDFLRWWLEFMQSHIQMLSSSNTQDNLNADRVRKMPVFLPREETQLAIAVFLDRETERIDALVAKKEALIGLLREERSALITRAVTKGLDPNVPMKDSGLEWLREIPVHWDVVRSKTLFKLRNIRALPGDEQLTASQQYGVIPQADFMSRESRRVVQVVTGADILKHAEANDFVISMRSFQGGIERSMHAGAISSAYVVLAPSNGVWGPYFAYLFKSKLYIQGLQSTSDLVRDGQALRFENFAQLALPAVPLPEQRSIATFLDRETARIDALVAKVRDAIDRLKEYRTALISAAVTGKIDVREEAS